MTTYTETIYRFRIFRHDDLPETHKAALRADGIDPDTRWGLIASFAHESDAETHFNHLRKNAASWETYKLVDAGKTETIERLAIL